MDGLEVVMVSQWDPRQPSQHSQQPQQRLPWWRVRWQDLSGFERFMVLVGVMSALILIFIISGPAATPTQPRSTDPQSSFGAQSSPVSTDTPLPRPTATPKGPRLLTGATLGGTQDGFTTQLGSPVNEGARQIYTFTTANGAGGVVQVFTQSGKDGNEHVAHLTEAPQNGDSWTPDQSYAAAALFMPPDTKHVRDFTDPQLGLIQVYQSADLAATFPAADFTDSGTGAALSPGTFGRYCGDQTAGCTFVLGD